MTAGNAPQRWPVWAWAYASWDRLPPHKGKHLILSAFHQMGLRSRRPFMWRMANGSKLALRAVEGTVVRETVGWTCFTQRRWEPHIESELARWLSPGDVAIDVGANLGYFTSVMAQLVGPSGRVDSFEPVPIVHEDLLLTVRQNGWHHVSCHRLAIGDAAGVVRMNFDPSLSANSAISADGEIEVTLVTLDDLLARRSIAPPRLIKVDTEGHDLAVLRGAATLIATTRPVVIFEVNTSLASRLGWSVSDVEGFFSDIGAYEVTLIRRDEAGLMDFVASPLERTPALGR